MSPLVFHDAFGSIFDVLSGSKCQWQTKAFSFKTNFIQKLCICTEILTFIFINIRQTNMLKFCLFVTDVIGEQKLRYEQSSYELITRC